MPIQAFTGVAQPLKIYSDNSTTPGYGSASGDLNKSITITQGGVLMAFFCSIDSFTDFGATMGGNFIFNLKKNGVALETQTIDATSSASPMNVTGVKFYTTLSFLANAEVQKGDVFTINVDNNFTGSSTFEMHINLNAVVYSQAQQFFSP